MADDKFTEKDLDRLNKAFKDSNDKVETLYDRLVDVFDISGKISAKYANVYKEIEKQNAELSISKELVRDYQTEIIQNKKEYNDLGKELVNNNKQLKILEAQENQNKLILEEKKELLREEFRTKQQIAGFEAALLESKNEQVRVSDALSKIDDRLKESAQNILAPAGEYNRILEEKKQLLERENELTTDITKNNELLNNKKKYQSDISDALISGATEYNRAEKENADIAMAINGIKEKNRDINLRQQEINERNKDLQKGIVDEEENQYQITKKIFELKAKLNFWQLVKMAYDRFVELDKAAEDFRKTTGFTNTQMVELRKNVEAVNKDFAALGVRIEVAYKAAQALTDVFGRTSLVTKDAIENIALMSANLGVVEADSAEVLSIFQGMGGATQEVAMNTMMAGAALSEKTGVPFSKVMSDIAKSSGTTAMLLGTNPSKLMKAAIAARALGTDLNAIAAQQEKLLNYSDSINSELEASALLGRSISFQRARQLAYEGKVEESAKATLDMVKQAGDFNEMNIYQRKALAAASGMELKDLTKMMAVEAQKNEIRTKGTPEQKKQLEMQEAELKKLRETNDLTKDSVLEENKKAIAQAKIQGLMTQINGILDQMKTIIADIVEPIITPLAKVMIPLLKVIGMLIKGIAIGFKFVLEPIVWIAEGIGSMVDGAASFGKSIDFVKDKLKDFSTGVITLLQIAGAGIFAKIFFGSGGPSKLMSMVSTPLKFAKDAVAGMMGKGAADPSKGLSDLSKGAEKVPSKGLSDLSKGAEKVPSKSGVKDFLSDLAAGLKKMGDGKVLFGALNLIPASIGLIAMIPAAIGMAAIGVTGQLFAVGAKGLATGLSALANPKVLLGTLALLGIGGAFALFGLGAKLVADAFVSIAAVIPDAIVPLTQLALLSPLLYVAAGGIGALAVGLGVLAAATIPATVASVGIYIIAKSVEKLGSSFEQVSKSTISLAKSIPTVINPIKQFASINMKETAEGMMMLSNSLASFGVGSAVAGIGSFVGNFLGGDPIAKMEKLASISDRLKDAASAISLIATATSRFSAVDSFAKSVGILADSLNKLTDSLGDIKTEELAKLSTITGATSAKTETAPTSATMTTGGIEAKLDKLTELLIGGAVKVHIDGKLVSSAMANTAGR